MNHYKFIVFVIVFWWSLLCPSSLGFPSDVLYPEKKGIPKNTTTNGNTDTEYRIHFKYLTFLNQYFD